MHLGSFGTAEQAALVVARADTESGWRMQEAQQPAAASLTAAEARRQAEAGAFFAVQVEPCDAHLHPVCD